MRITPRLLTGTALALVLCTPAAGAAIKCWTNNQGVRECGNAVPPEYAQQETRTINQRGMTLDVKERAQTPEEYAAEQQRRREEEARAAEEKRRREEQAKNDHVLLSTFASEQDIIMARDRQVSALKDLVEYTRLSAGKVEAKLADYQKRVEKLQSAGKSVPKNLEEDVDMLQKQLENKQDYIAAKQEEITSLQAKYDQDLQRFRELMRQRKQ
jgi:DNA repair exonuclease SbcCD ATPase subunit